MITFKPQIENPRQHGDTEVGEQVESRIQALCKGRDEINAQLDTLPEETAEVKDIAKEILKGLHKRILQFQTNKFFVAVFGSLKAGKSTLINALVGRHVSPTGYGQETTLHCSIILKATKESPEGIYLHRDTSCGKRSENALRRTAVTLLDYFREMETLDAVAARGVERSRRYDFGGYDFSGKKDNLTAVLTEKDLSSHPNIVLVELRLDCRGQNDFLDQVALFDMPGLEGCVANADNDKVIQELGNVADYFIYVQSSVGALSEDGAKFIESIVNIQKKPMVTVFNKVMGKYWLSEEAQREEQENYEKSARDLLACRANIRRMDAYNVNAAQAWNAVDEDFRLESLSSDRYPAELPPEEKRRLLREESGIEKLTEHLLEVCRERVVPIQDRNADEKYIAWRRETLRSDGKLKEYLAQCEKDLGELKKAYAVCQGLFPQIANATYTFPNRVLSSQQLDADDYRRQITWDLREKTAKVLLEFAQRLAERGLSAVAYLPGQRFQIKYDQYQRWDREYGDLIKNTVERIAEHFQAAGLLFLQETANVLRAPLNGLEVPLDIPENGAFATALLDFPKNVDGFSFSHFLSYPELPKEYRKKKIKEPGVLATLWAWILKIITQSDHTPQQAYRDDLRRRVDDVCDQAFKRLEEDVETCQRTLHHAMRNDIDKIFSDLHGKIQKLKTRQDAAKKLEEWLEELPKE